MAGEDLHREDNTRDHSFDELAKGLAKGSLSRGQALRWMGAAVLGGVLASIPGVALAQQGGPPQTPPGQGGTPRGRGGNGSPEDGSTTPSLDSSAAPEDSSA